MSNQIEYPHINLSPRHKRKIRAQTAVSPTPSDDGPADPLPASPLPSLLGMIISIDFFGNTLFMAPLPVLLLVDYVAAMNSAYWVCFSTLACAMTVKFAGKRINLPIMVDEPRALGLFEAFLVNAPALLMYMCFCIGVVIFCQVGFRIADLVMKTQYEGNFCSALDVQHGGAGNELVD